MENFEQQPVNPQPPMGSQPPIMPQPPMAPPPAPSKGMSIAALICGLLGIIGSFIPVVCYFTLVLAILGIIFGALGMKKAKETNSGKGLAVAGLVLGIIGTAFTVIGVICIASAAACASAALTTSLY